MTVKKTATGAEVSGLDGINAKGAKQLSADVSADGGNSTIAAPGGRVDAWWSYAGHLDVKWPHRGCVFRCN